jgi:hypothetical protein
LRRLVFTRPLRVSLSLTAASLAVFLLSLASSRVADAVNFYLGGILRAVPTTLFALFPFSVIEIVLIFAIPASVFLLVFLIRRVHDLHFVSRAVSLLLTCALLLLSSYLVTVACGYRTTPLARKMELPETEITVETLDRAARELLFAANALEGELVRDERGASVMPYSYDELSEELSRAYRTMNRRYSLTPPSAARLKPVLLSDLMSRARFAGIWSYVTGETNINVNPPDYCIPFTAAHEMAHQRGVAREDEANFVAFLVLSSSDSPYLRYAGYVGLFEYVASDLARLDRDAYRALAAEGLLSEGIRSEMRAYNDYYFSTEDGVISGVAGRVNDAYLKLNGTSGETSYDEVFRLAVAFFANP